MVHNYADILKEIYTRISLSQKKFIIQDYSEFMGYKLKLKSLSKKGIICKKLIKTSRTEEEKQKHIDSYSRIKEEKKELLRKKALMRVLLLKASNRKKKLMYTKYYPKFKSKKFKSTNF
jgi:hypothetical protein